MTHREKQVADAVAQSPDISNQRLGALVGLSETSACRMKRGPAVQQALAQLRQNSPVLWRGRILEGAAAALETLIELSLRGKTESARISAARTLLDAALRFGAATPTPVPKPSDEEAVRDFKRFLGFDRGAPTRGRVEQSDAGRINDSNETSED